MRRASSSAPLRPRKTESLSRNSASAAAAARAGDLTLAFADGRVPVRVTGEPAP